MQKHKHDTRLGKRTPSTCSLTFVRSPFATKLGGCGHGDFFFPEVVVVPASFWLWTFLGFLCFLLIFIPWLPLMTSGGLLMMRCLRPGSVTWMLWFQEVCQEGQEEQFHFCVPPWFHLCLCWLCWVCVCLSDQRFGPAVFSGVAIFGFPSLICFFLGWPRRNLLAWWPVSLWLQTNVRVWVDRMDCVFILTLKEHTLQCVACKLRAVLVPSSAPIWLVFIHTSMCQDRSV